MSIFGGSVTQTPGRTGLTLGLFETLRSAWRDPDLRSRIIFILGMFFVFVIGINIPVPIPNVHQAALDNMMKTNPFFMFANMLGGGALRRISIFALGLNPYITAAIIMQILTTAIPTWKKEMEEGGDYARQAQNKKTNGLSVLLCLAQGFGIYQVMLSSGAVDPSPFYMISTILLWTCGAMFMVWLGEQITEKGIGNGVSLMIFAGIVISAPAQITGVATDVQNGAMSIWQSILLIAIFLGTTWVIVLFTTAQRRIPMQHMRRNVGTRVIGGQTSYLPIPVNTAGVIPIIFAISLLFIPAQFATMLGSRFPQAAQSLQAVTYWLNPGSQGWGCLTGCLFYAFLIFFFTYFYTAIQYNVEDIANNLKKSGAFIPGVRPGKQTKDFLDGILSRITVAGAAFLTVVALAQFVGPAIAHINSINLNIIGGTSLLIMVQVAIDTMRQIEASLLMKQYGT